MINFQQQNQHLLAAKQQADWLRQQQCHRACQCDVVVMSNLCRRLLKQVQASQVQSEAAMTDSANHHAMTD